MGKSMTIVKPPSLCIAIYYKQLDAGNFWLIVHSPSPEDAPAQLNTFPYYGLGFITIRIIELDENKLPRPGSRPYCQGPGHVDDASEL